MTPRTTRTAVASLSILLATLLADCAQPQPTTRPAPRTSRDSVADRDDPDTAVREDGARTHRVGPTDTLYGLSQRFYGDGRQWRRIFYANRNRIMNPTELPIGMMLIIPPMPK